MTKNKAIFIYVPSPHWGYHEFFDRHPDVSKIFLLDETCIAALSSKKGRDYLDRSFLHKIPARVCARLVRCMGLESKSGYNAKAVLVTQEQLQKKDFLKELRTFDSIILPSEDISRFLVQDYFKRHRLGNKIDMSDRGFTRNNKLIPQREAVQPDVTMMTISPILKKVAKAAYKEAEKSSDWWRQVGGALFDEKKKKIIFLAHNKHLPEHAPNIYGDIRACFNAGENPEWVTAIHAEQNIFAQALQVGISMKGKSLYTTTYPCPVCAKMIALSGIKKVYYTEGYSVMEQAGSVMKQYGVKIIYVPYFLKN